MPYSIRKRGTKYALLKEGKTISYHTSKRKAEAAIRAIEANKHRAGRKS